MKSGRIKTLTFICETKNPRGAQGFIGFFKSILPYNLAKIAFKVALGRIAFTTRSTSGL